ncbi:MAG: hypothetical protein D6725_00040, partial [Planctomycetota bacterium]
MTHRPAGLRETNHGRTTITERERAATNGTIRHEVGTDTSTPRFREPVAGYGRLTAHGDGRRRTGGAWCVDRIRAYGRMRKPAKQTWSAISRRRAIEIERRCGGLDRGRERDRGCSGRPVACVRCRSAVVQFAVAAARWCAVLMVPWLLNSTGPVVSVPVAASEKAARQPSKEREATSVPKAATSARGPTPRSGAVVDPSAVHRRRLFVPAEDLEAILQAQPRGVLLDRAELERLQERARRAAGGGARVPGVAVELTRARYAIGFEAESTTVHAQFEVRQNAPGWHFVDLAFSGPSFERVLMDDRPAAVTVTSGKQPAWRVFTHGTGTHTLVFEGRLPLGKSGADTVVAFGFPPVPAAELRVNVPAGRFLSVDGLHVRRPEPLDAAAEVVIGVGGRRSVRLQLSDRPASRAADGLVFASTAYGVHVAPGASTWRAVVALQVYGTRLDRFTFRVPHGLEITDVTSPGLEAWELVDAADGFTGIVLDYRQPLDGVRRVTLDGVIPTDLGRPFDVPGLRIDGVQSHVGRLLVRYEPRTRLRQLQVEGLRPVTALPAAVVDQLPGPRDAMQFAFDAWREDFVLRLLIQPKEREVHAALSTLLDVEQNGVSLQTIASVETFFGPLFRLHFRLPAEWQISGVLVEDQPADWSVLPKAAGVHVVEVTFPKPLRPGAALRVTLSADRRPGGWPIEEQSARMPLPEVELLEATVVEGTYMIRGDDRLELVVESLRGLDPVKLGLPGERLGFRYQDTHFLGDLVVRRRPTVLASRILTFTAVEPAQVVTDAEIRVDISGGGAALGTPDAQTPSGGLRTLRIAVPERVDPAMEFRLVDGEGRIVEQSAGAPREGIRTWVLRFDRWVRGRVELTTRLRVPREKDQSEFELPRLRVIGSDWATGYVILEARPEQRLEVNAVDADGHPLAEVDVLDLPPHRHVPRYRIVAVHRFVADDYSVRVKETTFERVPVPTAVAQSLRIRSVLGRTGDWTHHAELTFSAAGVQSLAVQLHEGARLWSAAIDGHPQAVRRTDGQYLITLPVSTRPGAVRRLTIVYAERGPVPEVFGRLGVRPPVFGVIDGEGRRQPLNTLEYAWSVHHPRDLLLVATRPPYVPVRPLKRETLLGRLRDLFRVPEPERWFGLLMATGVVIVGLAVVVSLVRRLRESGLSWWGCATTALATVVTLVVLLLLAGLLLLPATQRARHAYRGLRRDGANAAVATAEAPVAGAKERIAGAEEDAAEAPMTAVPQAEAAADVAQFEDRSKENAPLPPAAKKPAPAAGEEQRLSRSPMVTDERSGRGGERSVRASGRAAGSNGRDAATSPAQQRPLDLPETGKRGARIASTGSESGPARASTRGAVHRGLLSLQLEFEPPGGTVADEFRYVGIRHGVDAPELTVAYENRPVARAVRWVLMTLAGFLFWWLREASWRLRTALGVFGVCLPLAVSPFAHPAAQIAADGVFFGAILGGLLWLLRWGVWTCGNVWRRLRAVLRGGTTGERGGAEGAGGAAGAAAVLLLTALVPATAGVARAQQPEREDGRLETVVIPVEGEPDPRSLPSDRVFLPLADYERLWRRAHPERFQPKPPIEGVISQAEYVIETGAAASGAGAASAGTVQGGAVVRGRIVAHNLGAADVWLRLPLGNVAVESLRMDGQPADVRTEAGAGQPLSVRVPPGALHVLDVTLRLAVDRRGPAGRIAFPVVATPATRVEFVVPLQDAEVTVLGPVGPYQRVRNGNGRTSVVFSMRNGTGVTIAWQPKQARAELADIVHCESLQVLLIDDRGVRLVTRHAVDVRRGRLTRLRLRIPAEGRLQAISGPLVSGWEVKAARDGQRSVIVYFRQPIEERSWVGLELYLSDLATDEPRKVAIPQVVPQDVQRDVGWLAIHASADYGLQAAAEGSLRPIHPDQFRPPGDLRVVTPLPRRFAYRFASRDWSVVVTVRRQPARSVAWAYHAVRVERRKVRYSSYVDLRFEDAARTAASLSVPPGFVVTELTGTGVVDWYFSDADAHAVSGRSSSEKTPTAGPADRPRVLSVEFGRPMLGRIELALMGFVSKGPNATSLSLVIPAPRGTDRLVTEAAVWVDPGYTAVMEEPDGWKSVDPAGLSQRLRQRLPQPIPFGLRSTASTLPPVPLKLQRARSQFRADSLTSITLSDPVLAYSIHCRWEFTRTADTFWLELPSWLGEHAHIRGPAIRETTAFADAENGRVRWRVRLQEPYRKEYVLEVRANLPPPKDRIATPRVVFLEPLPEGSEEAGAATEAPVGLRPISAQAHYVLLTNVSSSQLRLDTPSALQPVTSSPLVVDPELIAAAVAFGRIRSPRSLPRWTIQRLRQERGPAAVVLLADLITVVAADGTYRTQATYTVRNRGRQFLAVDLPREARLMAVTVAGRPSRAVRGADRTPQEGAERLRIPLPKTTQAARAFPVRVIIQGRLPGRLPGGTSPLRREVDVPAPRVVGREQDDELGIPVSRTAWEVFFPEQFDVVPIDDPRRSNLTPGTPADRQALQLLSYLDEASELLNVLQRKTSAKQRYYAWKNLKQLGVAVQSYQSSGAEHSRYGKDAAIRFEHFQRMLAENAVRGEQAEAVPQVPTLVPGQSVAPGAPESGGVLDEQQQVAVIESNSARLYELNVGRVDVLQATTDAPDNFRFEIGRQPPTKQGADGKKVTAGKTAAKVDKDAARKRQLEKSLAQLRIANERLQQQMSRQATPQAAAQTAQTRAPDRGRPTAAVPGEFAAQEAGVAGTVVMGGFGGGIGLPAVGGEGAGGRQQAGGTDGSPASELDGEVWTAAGGLSLQFEIPRSGRKLLFTKIGGGPRLRVWVRPQEGLKTVFALGWCGVWLVLSVSAFVALAQSGVRAALAGRWPWMGALIGLLLFWFVP